MPHPTELGFRPKVKGFGFLKNHRFFRVLKNLCLRFWVQTFRLGVDGSGWVVIAFRIWGV